ncbi:hypothetical protein OAP07_05390 [Bacteroidia bacterium]|jgi:hypothetical protein|nr:hypothetical protein [Bacteroidia bacterium]MDC3406375.1 hypothetical protein [Bacteroidia bacterium]CAI8190025.1 MAG: Uncharacterised protein [Bacteroidia bacterium]
MKASSISQIKKELKYASKEELIEIVLRIGKYKVENKELLSYLLFDSSDEQGYIDKIKVYMDFQFEIINRENYYFIKKSVRKILRVTKRFIKYSKNIETETTLLIHFCKNLEEMDPSYKYNQVLLNMYFRQLNLIEKNLEKMHEDLSYDFRREVDLLIK